MGLDVGVRMKNLFVFILLFVFTLVFVFIFVFVFILVFVSSKESLVLPTMKF